MNVSFFRFSFDLNFVLILSEFSSKLEEYGIIKSRVFQIFKQDFLIYKVCIHDPEFINSQLNYT